ncbi:MAG TPA: nuclear transport factor 2 family protein [Thermoplasmata archaeon]|nr:nuclear transport factor 2 family protein [Thermoplasmata archaeon]
MGSNKKIIEAHLTAPSLSKAAELLTDDVEWTEWGDGVPSTGVRTRGKDAYVQNYGDDELRTEILRMTEEGNVVVVEGVAHVHKKDGRNLAVRFCNIFELENGKIRRKSSFGALLAGAA